MLQENAHQKKTQRRSIDQSMQHVVHIRHHQHPRNRWSSQKTFTRGMKTRRLLHPRQYTLMDTTVTLTTVTVFAYKLLNIFNTRLYFLRQPLGRHDWCKAIEARRLIRAHVTMEWYDG